MLATDAARPLFIVTSPCRRLRRLLCAGPRAGCWPAGHQLSFQTSPLPGGCGTERQVVPEPALPCSPGGCLQPGAGGGSLGPALTSSPSGMFLRRHPKIIELRLPHCTHDSPQTPPAIGTCPWQATSLPAPGMGRCSELRPSHQEGGEAQSQRGGPGPGPRARPRPRLWRGPEDGAFCGRSRLHFQGEGRLGGWGGASCETGSRWPRLG